MCVPLYWRPTRDLGDSLSVSCSWHPINPVGRLEEPLRLQGQHSMLEDIARLENHAAQFGVPWIYKH